MTFFAVNKKSILVLTSLMIMFLFMTFSQFAEAKRLGGGKSFGMQKQVAPKSFNTQKDTKQATPQTQPAGQNAGTAGAAGTAAAGTAAKSGASKWLGPLAGIAAGGLLAMMLFGDGFEGLQILDFILFALLAFGLFMLARRLLSKSQTQQQPAYASHQETQQPSQFEQAQQETVMQRQKIEQESLSAARGPNAAQPAYNPNSGGSIFGADLDEPVGQAPTLESKVEQAPEWFDADGFVEGAKAHFVAMQAAWDAVDLEKLEGYCTPELFAALAIDLQGVALGDNHTHVDELKAEIAMMAVEGEDFIVSVRYSGFIEEDASGAHAFTEVWHIRRLAVGEGNWQVAGIQQSH